MFDFIEVHRWITRGDTLANSRQKLIMYALLDRANDAGECWPSLATLCHDTELSRSSVVRTLAELETLGVIERERRTSDSGDADSTLYRLTLSWVVSQRHHLVSERHNGSVTETLGVVSQRHPKKHIGRNTLKERKNIKKENRSDAELSRWYERHSEQLTDGDYMEMRRRYWMDGGGLDTLDAWVDTLGS